MNQTPGATDLTRIPLVRVLAVAVGIAALALLAPLVWLAATSGIGLLLLGGVVAAGFAALQALPLLGQKLENRLLAARKAEARRNPIEQLQNDMLRRAERLRAFRKALVTVGGKIESIRQMVAESRHHDPEHVLDQQQRALERLQQFHTLNLARLGRATAALDEFSRTVSRKEKEWVIAWEIADASELMDPRAGDQLIQGLLTDTALRTVQDRFNSVFAELDVQMSSLDSPTRDMLDARSRDPLDALELPQRQTLGSRP
jgi:hypothetical protein